MPTNTLLIGATGTGKTYAQRTWLAKGITPFIISTEPGIESTLGDLPDDQCHWHYIPPAAATWSDLYDSAKKINALSFDALTKLQGLNKQKYTSFLDVIATCNDFKCDRCGASFGDVGTWGPDRVLVLDSLSGLNVMALDLVTGAKPIRGQHEWGMAMDNLERFITTLVSATKCWTVITAHPERERDEVTGTVQVMASTLGRKLAPRLPRFFDDVIYAVRDGSNFFWSTIAQNVDLKARNLPLSDRLEPSFAQLVEAAEARRASGSDAA